MIIYCSDVLYIVSLRNFQYCSYRIDINIETKDIKETIITIIVVGNARIIYDTFMWLAFKLPLKVMRRSKVLRYCKQRGEKNNASTDHLPENNSPGTATPYYLPRNNFATMPPVKSQCITDKKLFTTAFIRLWNVKGKIKYSRVSYISYSRIETVSLCTTYTFSLFKEF